MGNKVPVMVLKNKSKENRYLAASPDDGDWDDPDLDVTLEDIENGYMIWRKDLMPPTEKEYEAAKKAFASYKRALQERFGPDAHLGLDFDQVVKDYEPVNIEISADQFEYAKHL